VLGERDAELRYDALAHDRCCISSGFDPTPATPREGRVTGGIVWTTGLSGAGKSR
jgi:hypothetical protein